MLKIILGVLFGFGLFCEYYLFVKILPEAKRDGLFSDEYIENNEEEYDDDRA
jgi:hypothetical protein